MPCISNHSLKKRSGNEIAYEFDSTSGNIPIFQFSQSFPFKLFLFLVTKPSAFSDSGLSSFLFQIVQKRFFNLLIYLTCGSIEISFLAHKKHTPECV